MKLAVVVIGDGRKQYLDQCVPAISANVTHPIYARIMVNDEADPAYCSTLDSEYPEWVHVHTGRVGMAGAVQAGYDAALTFSPDYTLWVEEDMLLTQPLPIADVAQVLGSRRDEDGHRLAQMMFPREPWWNDMEQQHGQWGALQRLSASPTVHGTYLSQDYIFSLNPCLIPRRVLQLGWDADNEAGVTKKLRDDGYVFGVWGSGETYARHIGHERSGSWRL